jgi:activator of HSP90 ATPase
LIVGRNIELVLDQRIVQAWRPTHWDPGVYSMVKFELKPEQSATTLILDHTGFPEGDFDGLDSGWPIRYWKPLAAYLAS